MKETSRDSLHRSCFESKYNEDSGRTALLNECHYLQPSITYFRSPQHQPPGTQSTK